MGKHLELMLSPLCLRGSVGFYSVYGIFCLHQLYLHRTIVTFSLLSDLLSILQYLLFFRSSCNLLACWLLPMLRSSFFPHVHCDGLLTQCCLRLLCLQSII